MNVRAVSVIPHSLGICERTLWDLTQQGLIPYVKLGRCKVYPVPGLIRFLEEQTINPIVRRPDADDAARGVDGSAVAR